MPEPTWARLLQQRLMQGITSSVPESMSAIISNETRGQPLQRTRDRFGDLAADERFAEHVADPCGLRSLAELWAAVAAHEYDGNFGVQLPDLARELGPRKVGHRLIGQYEIEALRLSAKRLQGRDARVKPHRLIVQFGKNLLRKRNQRAFIVHDHYDLAIAAGQLGRRLGR